MSRFRATIAYDGTAYNGWQIQPSRPTIQGALSEAIRHLTGESTLPQGAGRTDAGVHALAQVAHFDLLCAIPSQNLHRALNRSLPPAIRILDLAPAPADFHARHHASHKTYEYRILPRSSDCESVCPPFLAPFVWPCPRTLCLDLLNAAASQILGTHDFTSFAAVSPDLSAREAEGRIAHPLSLCEKRAESPVQSRPSQDRFPSFFQTPPATPNTRTILSSSWNIDAAHTPPILRYRVTGTGFLHHMVRNLVGTFTEQTRFPPAAIAKILAARNRQVAGPTAPPHGLFLAGVTY